MFAMTTRSGSPSTSTASQGSSHDLIDLFDIVANQGAYLVPRVHTPVFQKAYNAQFPAELEMHLDALCIVRNCRCASYNDADDEWPIGRTPPEVKGKREAELKAWDEIAGITSDESGDDDKDTGSTDIDARLDSEKAVTAPAPSPHQAAWLATPPLSAESSLTTPHRPKQLERSEKDAGEEDRPTKKHVSSAEKVTAQEVSATAEDIIPHTAQHKGRKRRRDLDGDDRPEGDEARPTKV
ncbi:Uu.00g136340.m01.CDS01 [Anthostomella pinea]|uniref:Uu.00g136340.m01.CDS01 n=1 Tax=Anthostomella pinea TaxID=933095 RepID=A0AAI8VQ26_9PEZI|nr:Uu.00g136340.m01.CDS01 [Anthostomella pinea]